MDVDLRTVSYDSWLKFIFDHPAPYSLDDEGERPKAWYWTDDFELLVEPTKQIDYLLRFCTSPTEILKAYTPSQIDQGLWYIFSVAGAEGFYEHLWTPEVPWPLRAQCIASLPELWPGLFERQDVGTMAFMLWDSLAYGYDCGNLHPGDNEEDHRVQDAMLAALTSQLLSARPGTQMAALHGLGHLSHPDGAGRIHAFLDRAGLDPDVRHYAEKVLKGEFQ